MMEIHSPDSPYYVQYVTRLHEAGDAEKAYRAQALRLGGQEPTEQQIHKIWDRRNLTAADREYYLRVVLQLY
jgi:hypothetical protein